MNRLQLIKHEAKRAAGQQCVVLSLTGQRLGVLGRFAGDRFSMETSRGDTLWVSSSAVYIENPLYVELICLADGLSRYAVDPPHGARLEQTELIGRGRARSRSARPRSSPSSRPGHSESTIVLLGRPDPGTAR